MPRAPRPHPEALCAALAAALAAPGCAMFPHSGRVARDGVATLMVASVPLGEPIRRVARHGYFALRPAGASGWELWEIWGGGGGVGLGYIRRHPTHDPLAHEGRANGPVMVHAVVRGDAAARMIACVQRESYRYEYRSQYVLAAAR